MFKRLIDVPLRNRKSFFLFGPRGTGKTTWLRQNLPERLFFNLLQSEHYNRLSANPGLIRKMIPLFFKVLVPAALPSLLRGLRIGLGTGWRVLVAAEMVVGTGVGLGYSIIQARWTLDYGSSFACTTTWAAI